MTETYLVATDMSARSDRAVRRAFRLARQNGAGVIVAHIVDDAPPPDVAARHLEASREALDRFVGRLDLHDRAEIIVKFGDPTADIIELVRTRRPGLLIMGTHRPRPFLDALRETTAQRIVRMTNCPVLMVRDREDHDYEQVIAATDFSPAATAAIEQAAQLSPGARILPVHAFHVPYGGLMTASQGGTDEIAASFRLEAQEADARWRDTTTLPESCGATSILSGSVMAALEQEIARIGATLVTAGAHGRVGAVRAILGSVATDLMRMPPCDVLIARPR